MIRMDLARRDTGLTLLDVLAAVVIAGIAFGVILQASALYTRQTSDAWNESTALVLGKSKAALFEVGAEYATAGVLATTGVLANFEWRVNSAAAPQRRAVDVFWERRGKRVALSAGGQIDPTAWQ